MARRDRSAVTVPLPDWIDAALVTPTSGSNRVATAERIAAVMAAAGMGPVDILRAMVPYQQAATPPMTASELHGIIVSACLYTRTATRAGVVSIPERTSTPGGWRYAWPAAGLAVTIESVMADRGAILAEVTIDAERDGKPVRVHGPVRTDLLSTSNRDGLARYLEGRHAAPWRDLVETAFGLAIDAYRMGEPVILLRDAPPVESAYAIAPLVSEGDVTVWHGKGASGKSILALAAAAALDGSAGVLPLDVLSRHTVLYLDWEWRADRHRRRLSQLLGAGAHECGVLYRHMTGPMVAQVESIRRAIADHGVTYVVIDSLGMAAGGEPENAGIATAFANAVSSLGVGSLWITHVSKSGDGETPFGSVYWYNLGRSVWQVQPASEEGDPVMRVLFTHRKCNDGRLEKPLLLRVSFDDGRAFITRGRVEDDADFGVVLSDVDRVFASIEGGEGTLAGLRVDTGLSTERVGVAIRKLQNANRVFRDGLRWRVAPVATMDVVP